jgi:hypothetical protein
MRQAKDAPELVVGLALAIPNDNERCRRLAATADDLARSLLDTIHDGERERPQQIRDSTVHAINNMCAAHKNNLTEYVRYAHIQLADDTERSCPQLRLD